MVSFSDIIDRAGGATALARKIGEDPNNVHAWKRLNTIPAHRWAVCADAEVATLEELAAAAAAKKSASKGEAA